MVNSSARSVFTITNDGFEIICDLGGGRLTNESVIDSRVGVDALRKPGEAVQTGDPLCLHTAGAALSRLQTAFERSKK